MSWGKLKDIKGAQIVRILNRFSDYVRNIFAFMLLPWYLRESEGSERRPNSDAGATSTTEI
jgi:hypothetical protein